MSGMRSVQYVDSHTGVEPTRVIIDGGPDLGGGTLAERRERLIAEHDHFRSAVVNEPRGSDVYVGALLCEPDAPDAVTGVIFFNNVGALGMCGHGTIGVVATLAWLGRIAPGRHIIDTPVGPVEATLHDDGRVTIRNVPAWRHRAQVPVQVDGLGEVRGDIAWGGNWFFLVHEDGVELDVRNAEALTDRAWQIRRALEREGITGAGGGVIDHIELIGPPSDRARADSRNFVLCPGGAWDRSPCGTGTSAKLACLHADGRLQPGQVWRQESIIGSIFEGSIEIDGEGRGIPSISARAFVNAEGRLVLNPADPFCHGIRT